VDALGSSELPNLGGESDALSGSAGIERSERICENHCRMRALAPYVVATVMLSGSVMLFAGQGSNPIRAQLQQGVHGSLFWNNNSVFSDPSFRSAR